jgi:hypothetical protein
MLHIDITAAQCRQLTPAQAAKRRQQHQRPVLLRHHLGQGDDLAD